MHADSTTRSRSLQLFVILSRAHTYTRTNTHSTHNFAHVRREGGRVLGSEYLRTKAISLLQTRSLRPPELKKNYLPPPRKRASLSPADAELASAVLHHVCFQPSSKSNPPHHRIDPPGPGPSLIGRRVPTFCASQSSFNT